VVQGPRVKTRSPEPPAVLIRPATSEPRTADLRARLGHRADRLLGPRQRKLELSARVTENAALQPSTPGCRT